MFPGTPRLTRVAFRTEPRLGERGVASLDEATVVTEFFTLVYR